MRTTAVIALLLVLQVQAQRSPFNGRAVGVADSTGRTRILIGGHFHGESTNRSGFPARTLLANIDTINALRADLFLSTGDLFLDPVGDRPRYDRTLFSRLEAPLFNAPGNHDVDGGAVAPGPDRIDLPASATRVLLLDTEDGDGALSDAELGQLRDLAADRAVRHAIIVSHRPLWAERNEAYAPLFQGNTHSLVPGDFDGEVLPILRDIATHASVHWISGSMGGTAPSSIFFQPQEKGITYVQCAIRDVPRDALLVADVTPDTIAWTAISLTGQALLPVERYDAAWWREHQGKSESFNWKLLPYLVRTTVTHRAFWWGAGAALVVLWLGSRVLRRFRRPA